MSGAGHRRTARPDVNEAELEGWSEHTLGPFGVSLLDAGHFFADDPALREAVLRTVIA